MFNISKIAKKKILEIAKKTAAENNVKVTSVQFNLSFKFVDENLEVLVSPYYKGDYQGKQTLEEFLD